MRAKEDVLGSVYDIESEYRKEGERVKREGGYIGVNEDTLLLTEAEEGEVLHDLQLELC